MNDSRHYEFADGAYVWITSRHWRPGPVWAACWADGTPLREIDRDGCGETTSFFPAAVDALRALAAGGEGPAADPDLFQSWSIR